ACRRRPPPQVILNRPSIPMAEPGCNGRHQRRATGGDHDALSEPLLRDPGLAQRAPAEPAGRPVSRAPRPPRDGTPLLPPRTRTARPGPPRHRGPDRELATRLTSTPP